MPDNCCCGGSGDGQVKYTDSGVVGGETTEGLVVGSSATIDALLLMNCGTSDAIIKVELSCPATGAVKARIQYSCACGECKQA